MGESKSKKKTDNLNGNEIQKIWRVSVYVVDKRWDFRVLRDYVLLCIIYIFRDRKNVDNISKNSIYSI